MAFTHGNILATFFSATRQEIEAGRTWYLSAKEVALGIANSYNVSLDSAIGVISALSPSNKWERNCRDADNLIRVYASGGDPDEIKVSTYGNNKQKAIRILEDGGDPLDILGGYKVQAFYSCIKGSEFAVCVDGHVYSYWIGERIATSSTPKISAKLYATISEDHRIACKLINEILQETFLPCDVQAICWLVWRRLYKGVRK